MDLFKKIFGAPVAGISAEEARTRLKQQGKPFLLDVRQPEEYQSGHIHGATLIPLGSLPARMGELPKEREIICVCRPEAGAPAQAECSTRQGFAS